MSTLIYTIPGTITDTSLPIIKRDDLISGDNGGVLWLADLANSFCYAAGVPSDGKAVKDMGEVSADGVIGNPSGNLAAGGNGIDFSSIAAGSAGHGYKLPASVSAALWADQQFLICAYVKLPTADKWPTASGLYASMFSDSAASYATTPELCVAGFRGSGSASVGISFRRQTGANASEQLESGTASVALHAGLVAQVAAWRSGTTFAARIKSAGGTTLAALISGTQAANTQDFSARQIAFGNYGSFGGAAADVWGDGLRHFRSFVENLAVSGRDPVTVLDADWTRVVARAVYS